MFTILQRLIPLVAGGYFMWVAFDTMPYPTNGFVALFGLVITMLAFI